MSGRRQRPDVKLASITTARLLFVKAISPQFGVTFILLIYLTVLECYHFSPLPSFFDILLILDLYPEYYNNW